MPRIGGRARPCTRRLRFEALEQRALLSMGDLIYTITGSPDSRLGKVAADGDLLVVGAPALTVGGQVRAGGTFSMRRRATCY